MKKEGLMIGDTVKFRLEIFSIDYEGIETEHGSVLDIGKVSALNSIGNVWVIDSEGQEHQVTEDEIEPISLTRDIFEKNGFRYEQGYSSEAYWLEADENFHAHYQDKYGYHVIWTDAYGDENIDKKISYVHELQHLLKLCGIKKEIIL